MAIIASETVQVDGGLIAGTLRDGVRVYKGVPFAAPPVGPLRWKPPQPVVPWTGVRRADVFPGQCPQRPYWAGAVYATADVPQTEDCLYLNVWSAGGPGDRRPVMVWIHGGAWTRGCADIDQYDGAQLARRGVVLVAPNYRLGVFGFLAHPELTAESPHRSSGNYAILDHLAALEWVRRNIAAFGGDPANVTVFGESAGSWSINVLQASPLAKGLFHRAIGQSGAQLGPRPYPSAARSDHAFAEQAGVALAASLGLKSIAELRAASAERLLSAPKFRTAVHADGWVLPDTVHNIFAARKHHHVPLLAGSTADEYTTLQMAAPMPHTLEDYRARAAAEFGDRVSDYDHLYPVNPLNLVNLVNPENLGNPGVGIAGAVRRAVLDAARDRMFTLQMRRWVRMNGPANAYLFFFSHVTPRPDADRYGAHHGSEIIYVFDNLHLRDWMTATDRQLADVMSRYWVNFARTGDPNGPGLPAWPAYDTKDEPYMDFGHLPQLRHHLLTPQLDFLESFERGQTPV